MPSALAQDKPPIDIIAVGLATRRDIIQYLSILLVYTSNCKYIYRVYHTINTNQQLDVCLYLEFKFIFKYHDHHHYHHITNNCKDDTQQFTASNNNKYAQQQQTRNRHHASASNMSTVARESGQIYYYSIHSFIHSFICLYWGDIYNMLNFILFIIIIIIISP